MEVREESAAFAPVTAASRSQFRRIAGVGPAYELVADLGEMMRVRILETGEEFDYRRADYDADPAA